MSDVMTQGIIGMPYDLAMGDELSRRQFHSRAQELLADYAALKAELARLRAGQEPVAYITGQFAGRCVIEAINRAAVLPTGMALYTTPQPSAVPAGWKLVPVERITIALESVQNAMEDAYNNAYQECCGRGQGQCCGDPVAAWSDADTAIMDALAPAQRELSALLAAAPSAPKADDPVKVELLGALEDVVAWAYRNTKWDCVPIGLVRAQCAIAAARQEGGKV